LGSSSQNFPFKDLSVGDFTKTFGAWKCGLSRTMGVKKVLKKWFFFNTVKKAFFNSKMKRNHFFNSVKKNHFLTLFNTHGSPLPTFPGPRGLDKVYKWQILGWNILRWRFQFLEEQTLKKINLKWLKNKIWDEDLKSSVVKFWYIFLQICFWKFTCKLLLLNKKSFVKL